MSVIFILPFSVRNPADAIGNTMNDAGSGHLYG